jgi:hypothetical protein
MEDSLDADEPRLQELAQFSDNEDFYEEIIIFIQVLYLCHEDYVWLLPRCELVQMASFCCTDDELQVG